MGVGWVRDPGRGRGRRDGVLGLGSIGERGLRWVGSVSASEEGVSGVTGVVYRGSG